MPIEIKELHIKAVVNQAEHQASSGAGNGAAGASLSSEETDKLVAECVEKVLEILRQRNER